MIVVDSNYITLFRKTLQTLGPQKSYISRTDPSVRLSICFKQSTGRIGVKTFDSALDASNLRQKTSQKAHDRQPASPSKHEGAGSLDLRDGHMRPKILVGQGDLAFRLSLSLQLLWLLLQVVKDEHHGLGLRPCEALIRLCMVRHLHLRLTYKTVQSSRFAWETDPYLAAIFEVHEQALDGDRLLEGLEILQVRCQVLFLQDHQARWLNGEREPTAFAVLKHF